MEENLYYSNPKFQIGNDKYFLYMCEGQRGRGKSTWWLQKAVEHSLESGFKFIYLRRSEKELELALEKGIFNCCRSAEPYANFWLKYPKEETRGGNIFLIDKEGNKTHVGYTLTLNNVKGISIEDSDFLIFDEYVAVKRSKYKGGESGLHEPEMFLRLLETVFRRRKFWAVLLGNKDTPSNPYNECWKIPFGCQLHKDKSCGIWYEYDYSEATARHKESTVIGLISKNTSYSDYSQGVASLDDVDPALIADKTPHSHQIYNVKAFGELLTVWKDNANDVMYYTAKCKMNNACPTICVTNSDMTVNTDFIKYHGVFLTLMRIFYGSGKIKFDSQKTASLFATMMSLK